MLFIVCTVIVAAYILFIMLAFAGWLIPSNSAGEPNKIESNSNVTVIIPFRNEELVLLGLIASLKKQTYQPKILFIDDHSTDHSAEIIRSAGLEVILSEGIGKKNASATGISHASTPFLIFIDADCVLKNTHVEDIVKTFGSNKFDFSYGPVVYIFNKQSFLNSVFFLDQLSLNSFSIGTGKLNLHLFCSGANMAGKKDVVGNATKLLTESKNLSGDDITLMSFCVKSKKKVIALTDKKFTVSTYGPKTLGEFFRQRLRWGQKTGFGSNWLLLLVSLIAFLTSCSVIFSLISSLSDSCNDLWLVLPLAKLVIDLLFLFLVSRRLEVTPYLWFFLPAWIFNLVYIPIIGITGLVYSGNWKGRKIRS